MKENNKCKPSSMTSTSAEKSIKGLLVNSMKSREKLEKQYSMIDSKWKNKAAQRRWSMKIHFKREKRFYMLWNK
jgi:hypothetical protein